MRSFERKCLGLNGRCVLFVLRWFGDGVMDIHVAAVTAKVPKSWATDTDQHQQASDSNKCGLMVRRETRWSIAPFDDQQRC